MTKIYQVPKSISEGAHVDLQTYEKMYRRSIEDGENFWREHGSRIDWIRSFTKVKDVSYDQPDVYIQWYYDCLLYTSDAADE